MRASRHVTNFAASPHWSHPVRRVLFASLFLFAAACGGGGEQSTPTRTKEEQRRVDSTVGASNLPGARGVQGAMKVADSSAARNRQLDSLSKLP